MKFEVFHPTFCLFEVFDLRIFLSPLAQPKTMLTKEQLEQWDQDGYLVIPDLINPEYCEELRDAITRTIVDKLDLLNHPRACITTFLVIITSRDHLSSSP